MGVMDTAQHSYIQVEETFSPISYYLYMYTIIGSLELKIIFWFYIGLTDMHVSTIYGSSYPESPQNSSNSFIMVVNRVPLRKDSS